MVSSSGVSKTIVLSSNYNELSDRLTTLLQEKHAGKNSDLFNPEIFATVDKLLEYKSISDNEHEQILTKCNLLHKRVQILIFFTC